ncbi:MAG: hypothetical protein Q7S40_33140 [Opitutaceae bacterium]|nr:hypothetical protein [Opitutaceae bacterium]
MGAFPLESGSKDAATSVTLAAGSYTVHLTAKPGESGVALVEIYEDDNEADRMLNLSTRAFVAPGFPAIAGLGVRGAVPKKMLLRAVGPTLAGFGVGQPLSNPRLELKDERATTVALNDDWEANSNLGELRGAATAVGAFPLSAGSRDAALLVTLSPGNFTAIVESGANESGVVLVEVYEVQRP